MTTSFQTNTGHYLCAEGGGGREINATRTAVGPWETFEVVALDGGTVALQAANGQYVCAELGGGEKVNANRNTIGPWETWTTMPVDGGVALQSVNGHFLCAELGGGGAVNATRTAVGPWETFVASGLGPGPGTHPHPIRGILRTDGDQAFIDDTGDVLPCSLHLGDGMWRNIAEPARIDALLPQIAKAGWHIVRSWAILNDRADRNNRFWGYLALGPRATQDWKAQMVAYGRKLAANGLVWHLSLGEYAGLSDTDLGRAYTTIGDAIQEIGPEHVVWAGEINESHFNADGRSPIQVRAFVDLIRQRFPNNVYCLSHIEGTEDIDTIRSWTATWQRHYVFGGFRGGQRPWDQLAHHHFGMGYEGPGSSDNAPRVRRLGAELEGEDVRMSARQWPLICAATCLARGIPNLMLPNGARLIGDITQDAGFWTVPQLLRELPRDLHRFQHLEHGGARFRGVRPLSAEGVDGTRVEYARHDDGRFVMHLYVAEQGKPGRYSFKVERPFTGRLIPPDVTGAFSITKHPGETLDLDLIDGVVLDIQIR